jgi:hypothetical protein
LFIFVDRKFQAAIENKRLRSCCFLFENIAFDLCKIFGAERIVPVALLLNQVCRTGFYPRIMLLANRNVITAARAKITVLIGVKEQMALCPSRHGLLAFELGISVLTAGWITRASLVRSQHFSLGLKNYFSITGIRQNEPKGAHQKTNLDHALAFQWLFLPTSNLSGWLCPLPPSQLFPLAPSCLQKTPL